MKEESKDAKIRKSPKMACVDESLKQRKLRVDLVFPHGNEKHLVDMALRLNINHLIMCYSLDDPAIKLRKKETQLFAQENLTTEFAIIVSTQQEASKAKSLTSTIVGYCKPELLDDKRVSHIINMESSKRDDFIHHKNSGLNQVFLEQAKSTSKTILVNANKLIFEDKMPRAIILGRIIQNNSFYKKYRPIVIAVSGAQEPMQMRSYKDLQTLLELH